MRALRVDARVFSFITGENLAAPTSPDRDERIEVMLCSQFRTAGSAALDFRPQKRGLAKEPRRLA